MNKNYIVLNGKHYDAVTGALLKQIPNQVRAAHTHTAHNTNRNPHVSRLQPAVRQQAQAPQGKLIQKTVSREHHGGPKVLRAHKPEHPKTLMRTVVKKPMRTQKTAIKPAYPLAKTASGITITPKVSATNVDGTRQSRAQQLHKSHHVTRFTEPMKLAVPTKIKPLAIKPVPAHAHQHVQAGHSTGTAHVPMNTSEKKTAMLERALANANSHEEPTHAPARTHRFKHQRLVSSLAGLTAVLLLVGFVAYLNKASVELQVASVRAGFQASMPGYAPEGFERQPAKADGGAVAINFVSPVQKNGFTLSQEASSWDSQTLFDSIVAQDNTTYQTIQSNGRTIYIYGDDKAAWVDGGILYKVGGNAKLNSDQIISLATSM